MLDLYEQTHRDMWDKFCIYDYENAAIVIRKLISDPDARKTIFDLRDGSLERLLSSLYWVTVYFQCLDATLLTNFICRLFITVTLVYLPGCDVTCWRRRLNGHLIPALSGVLIQERVM